MPRLRIVPLNHHDYATLTTSAASVTDFGIEHTQSSIRDHLWRTTSTATQSFSGSLTADREANSFSLFRHTAHGGDIQLELYSDDAFTTNVYDSTALAASCFPASGIYDWGDFNNDPQLPNAPYQLWLGADYTFRSYRVSFSGTPTAAYWQASRACLGKAFEFTINPNYGASLGFATNTDRNRSRGGSLRTNRGEIWRTFKFDLGWVDELDRETLVDLFATLGTGVDFMVSMYPEDTTRKERDNMMMGKFASLNSIQQQISWMQSTLQIEEN